MIFLPFFLFTAVLIVIETILAKRAGLKIHSYSENISTGLIFLVNFFQFALVSTFYQFFHFFGLDLQHLKTPGTVESLIRWVETNFSFSHYLSGIPKWILLFLVVDAAYYLSHRLSHKVNILWAGHSVHHSFTKYNILAAHRDPIFFLRLRHIAVIVLLPIFTFFTLSEVVITYTLISIYSTWLHVDFAPKIKFIDKVFTTPSHHRMHHSLSIQDRSLRVNFGGVLIIWDRIFGTFAEENENRHLYGLPGLTKPANIFHVLFFEWIKIFKSLRQSRSLKGIFSSLFWKV